MPQSLANILVHIVFSTKERFPFLEDRVLREALHQYLGGSIKEQDGQPLGIGGVSDHVHILCAMSKNTSAADFIRDLKRASSIWIKQQPAASEKFAWQTGYGIFSVGQTEIVAVQGYIANQEEHYRTQTFQDEYRAFLKKYGVRYDERYVWD
jgi:putative transposase